MVAIALGDVINGGPLGYYQVLSSLGVHKTMVQVLDDEGEATQLYITGATVRFPTGDVYTTSTPSLTMDNTPHDCDWVPNDAGILTAVVPSPGVLKFRLYSFAEPAVLLDEWTPDVEAGWAQQAVKISVACDSRSVYYTQSLYKIQRFDIVDGVQLDPYMTLPYDSPYRFKAVRVLPGEAGDNRDTVLPMTATPGDGPSAAIALAPGRTFWVDNKIGADYVIEQRQLSDRAVVQTVVTQADEVPTNDRTLALACYFNACAARERVWISSIGV